MDLVELNDNFAPQYLAVEKSLDLHPSKINMTGTAIALSQPLSIWIKNYCTSGSWIKNMLLDPLVLEMAEVSHSSFRAQSDESKEPTMALLFYMAKPH